MKRAFAVLILLALAGCAHGWGQFYNPFIR
jgi:hypothetical protein